MKLGVNVDHVATLRQARMARYPDPVDAAVLAQLGGADGITVHLREDRRHINERDVRLLKDILMIPLNLEMSVNEEIVKIALDVVPDQATIVPEKRQELTTEGGLDVVGGMDRLRDVVSRLQERGTRVHLFIDPDERSIDASRELGVEGVELHTGRYADAPDGASRTEELRRIREAAVYAAGKGLFVAAGHGLNYVNVSAVAAIEQIEELNIGHSIVAMAVLVGMERAVKEMKSLMMSARGGK